MKKQRFLLDTLIGLVVSVSIFAGLKTLSASAYTGSGTESNPYVITSAGDAGWTELNNLMQNSCHIKLKSNITGNTKITVPSGKTVVLELDGATINSNQHFSIFYVVGDLTLKCADSASVNTGRNCISGGDYGVEVKGRFTLENCLITGAKNNGVFINDGTFTMNSGVIDGNNTGSTTYKGGGVFLETGSFIMNDGKITNNSAVYGGGVYAEAGHFYMYGGLISLNSAENGGGVCVSNSSFIHNNGTIEYNTATQYGGGVFCNVSKDYCPSDSAIVKNNYKGGTITDEAVSGGVTQNVYLPSGIKMNAYKLTNGSIGITMESSTGVFNEYGFTEVTVADVAKFFSDIDSYAVGLTSDRKAYLGIGLSDADVILANQNYTYNRSEQNISLAVTKSGTTLTKDIDYTVTYKLNGIASQPIAAGNYTIEVTGKENYAGIVSKSFKVNPKPVTIKGITAKNKIYDGNTNATLDFTNAIFEGICDGDTLTVTATGSFSDANEGENKTVNISGLKLGGASASNYVLAASGQQISTKASITKSDDKSAGSGDNNGQNGSGSESGKTENQNGNSDGTGNNSSPQGGNSDVTGNTDTATAEVSEQIDRKQKTTSFSKITGAKGYITVTWKKQTKGGIKGYEIQYSTDKKFKKKVTKTITIKKAKTTKTKIKKLKSKKKYYIRIRTFSKKNGKKIYSKWSKSKSVKVK